MLLSQLAHRSSLSSSALSTLLDLLLTPTASLTPSPSPLLDGVAHGAEAGRQLVLQPDRFVVALHLCMVSHCTEPHCIATNRTASHRIATNQTKPHCTAPHCTALQCTVLGG